MSLTIIAHIWNESYLLPWWLAHHVPRADHGIIFDYASDDGSPDMIRAAAPTWDVRQSRNRDFDAAAVDQEVMDAEREVDGWKIVLNVTEFLVGDVSAAMQKDRAILRSRILCDPPDLVDVEPNPHLPLVIQRTAGLYDASMRPGRLLHYAPSGDYNPGRHITEPPTTAACEVWWYGFSPWTPRFRERKMQIQMRVPPSDLAVGRGWHHCVNEAQQHTWWRQCAARIA